jgi:hypothetical protein
LAYNEFNQMVLGFSRAVEKNPEDLIPRLSLADSYVRRAQTLLTMKKIHAAQRDYERAIDLANTLPETSQDTEKVPVLALTYSGLSAVEWEKSLGKGYSRHHKLECEYASRSNKFFALMQKSHGMDLDEREEMRLLSNRFAACRDYQIQVYHKQVRNVAPAVGTPRQNL